MAKYIATDEDANSSGGGYITEAGKYEFKTTKVEHKVNQRDGTDLFECTFTTKDGASMRKTFFWGDLSLPTSQYRARALIFMYLKACGVKIYRDELDSEDAVGFHKIVENKKFTAHVEMQPDRNDPEKRWPEIGFAGFVFDQDHVLYKTRQSLPRKETSQLEDSEIDEPW